MVNRAVSSLKDNAGVGFPPPFVYLGFLLLGLVADRVLPWTLQGGAGWPWWTAGSVIAIIGMGVVLTGTRLFDELGNNVPPWLPATVLVTGGVYRFTRNPMYLGAAFTYFGLAIAFRSLGALALLAVVILVIRTQVIAREERYLTAKFGDDYVRYMREVRRWF